MKIWSREGEKRRENDKGVKKVRRKRSENEREKASRERIEGLEEC